MKATLERRFVTGGELRATKADRIEGYCAVFNSPSADLGGFTEIIRPGAFSRAIRENQDVLCLFNHNPSAVLGRTRSGTLRLSQDRVGLYFECDTPGSQIGRDVHTLIQRGDISSCSFSFSAASDDWSRDFKQRQLLDVDLFDVSPVTFPAYPATSVDARSLWPEGLPQGVRAHRISDRVSGCYELKGQIYVPTPIALDVDLETERCRARGRLAQLEL